MTLIESPVEPQRAPASHSARDAYIAGRLVTAYALSEQLSPFALRVEVKDAVVRLCGAVDDRFQRELAGEIARDIDDVRDVRNELVVEAPAPRGSADRFARRFNDASLAARVRTRLCWNGETHCQDIHAAALEGVVTLTGTVSSEAIRDLAGQLAQEVPGVARIENRLLATRQ